MMTMMMKKMHNRASKSNDFALAVSSLALVFQPVVGLLFMFYEH